jgi:hypothetical protein
MEPTDWFRIRHTEPFSDEVFAVFKASCAIYAARIETTLANWDTLPLTKTLPKPEISFFPAEVSEDRRVMSLPIRVERQSLGSRSLLQSSAPDDLRAYLPFPLAAEVEVGLTEASLTRDGDWRHDWWNPNKPFGVSGEQVLRNMGITPVPLRPPRMSKVRYWLCRLLGHFCRP